MLDHLARVLGTFCRKIGRRKPRRKRLDRQRTVAEPCTKAYGIAKKKGPEGGKPSRA